MAAISGEGAGDEGGARTPPNLLICQKFGRNVSTFFKQY